VGRLRRLNPAIWTRGSDLPRGKPLPTLKDGPDGKSSPRKGVSANHKRVYCARRTFTATIYTSHASLPKMACAVEGLTGDADATRCAAFDLIHLVWGAPPSPWPREHVLAQAPQSHGHRRPEEP
jgi:hypothetical protein